MSVGTFIPVIVGWYMDQTVLGITASLGAICVGLADSPGKFSHKIKGLLFALALTFITTIWVSSMHEYKMVFTISVLSISFLGSYISLYGNRGAVVGTSILLAMSFASANVFYYQQHKINPLFWTSILMIGGIWYILLSSFLWRLSPYKTAQLAVINSYKTTATFIRQKAKLFDSTLTSEDFERLTEALIKQQSEMHHAIDIARDELFTRRSTLQGTTRMGRLLVLWHQKIVNIGEAASAIHQDYGNIRESFGDTEITNLLNKLFNNIASEIEQLSELILNDDVKKKQLVSLADDIKAIRKEINDVKNKNWDKIPLVSFVVVKNILRNMSYITSELNFMEEVRTEEKPPRSQLSRNQLSKFADGNIYRISSLRTNFSPESPYFRHAIRLTIAVALGLIFTDFVKISQAHWILLTIVVIMKPDFGATKLRSLQRVAGTILGGLVAIGIIKLVDDQRIILALLFIFSFITYSFISVNYAIGVIFITPYALLLFDLIDASNLNLAGIRMLDTFVGGSIVYITNMIIPPLWQYQKMPPLMENMLNTAIKYFSEVMKGYTSDQFSEFHYKMARKDATLALTNLSQSFQAMLNEPSQKQKANLEIYSFVVLSHTLLGHIATLSVHRDRLGEKRNWATLQPIKVGILSLFENALDLLKNNKLTQTNEQLHEKYLEKLDDTTTLIANFRYEELARGRADNTKIESLYADYAIVYEQIKFIYQIAKDYNSVILRIAPLLAPSGSKKIADAESYS